MYKILKNEKINKNIYLLSIKCPIVIKKALPGQFVIIMSQEDSERIPLTIYDYDLDNGILNLIYQVVGASTKELSENKEEIFALTGPLGNPNEICKNPDKYQNKRIVYIAGGVGIAPVYPQVKYLKGKGFNIDVIYGARNKDLLIIKEKIEKVADRVYYVTDDGTYGEKGFVTDVLKKHINEYDICVAIGPVIMMKNISELTRKYNLKTIVSMNPIMVDGTGMCGACRCEVEGKPKFACIDGPEFDGHKIDFDIALKRLNIYKEEEEKLKNRGEEKSD